MVSADKNTYIFPKGLAKRMAIAPMQMQLEAGMLSTSLLMLGMLFMMIYMGFFMEQSLIFKIGVVFNLICGFVLMGSQVVTMFQQYQYHLETMGIDTGEQKKEIKKRGNIFKRIKLAREERKARKLAELEVSKQNEILEKMNFVKGGSD
jgi:hypothetical protein